jgi:hypothetical protein
VSQVKIVVKDLKRQCVARFSEPTLCRKIWFAFNYNPLRFGKNIFIFSLRSGYVCSNIRLHT